MKRLLQWLKALFNKFMDTVEDPEVLLDQARRDMQEVLQSNKEKAVQALAMKNRLQALVEDTEQKMATCEKKAELALGQGNRDLALQFMAEKKRHGSGLEALKASLASAERTVENVKIGIRRQEQEVRQKAAEALALKAQWKQAQIQNSIAKALDGLSFENQLEGFGAAEEKIKMAQSEANARTEMFNESLEGKVMALDDQIVDVEAENDLKELEARLGIASPASAETKTSAEEELAALENRLGTQ